MCRKLLTINAHTHKGLFQYNRLSFKVKCALAVVLQIIDTMLSGIDGTNGYLGDILVIEGRHEQLMDRLDQF